MYNADELIRGLKRGGFSKFNESEISKSDYSELRNLEWRPNSTCIVEAIK